jgi:hypothetical protein
MKEKDLMKSMLRIAGGAVVLLALFVFMGALVVSAQGPTGTPTTPAPAAAPPLAPGTTLDDPAKAVAIGGTLSAIPAGTGEWYSFTYNNASTQLPRPTVTIRLLDGAINNLRFEIYAPESFMNQNWFDSPPVGRGNPEIIQNCASSADNSGHCSTADLVWTGGFGLNGTYFIRVVNDNPTNMANHTAVAPQLIISGPGLAQCADPSLGKTETFPSNASSTQGFAAVDCAGTAGPTPAPTP